MIIGIRSTRYCSYIEKSTSLNFIAAVDKKPFLGITKLQMQYTSNIKAYNIIEKLPIFCNCYWSRALGTPNSHLLLRKSFKKV